MILDNPGKYISESVRLDTPRLMRKVGDTSDLRQLEVIDLEDFRRSAEQRMGITSCQRLNAGATDTPGSYTG